VFKFNSINLKGDLFATGLTFALQGLIKLGSSLVLTRILVPEAYGIITVLMSIVFFVEMTADLGATVFVVRDKNGESPSYLNTAWTLRLGRGLANGTLIFLCAPFVAHLYGIAGLATPLRVFSLWFVIGGLESMSFPVAIRRKQSRLLMYSELLSTLISTTFAIVYSYYSRDFWGMLYATLLGKALLTLFSYRFYPELRPKLQYNSQAARDMFRLTRFILPSSFLSMLLLQFDKLLFLRFFDLYRLGLYGLAQGIAGPVDALITNICRMVLYPRCAHNFRSDPASFPVKYYTENVKLFMATLSLPAAVWGAAHVIIAVLYPSRYSPSTPILQAFMLRASLLALGTQSEEMLIAAGHSHVILIGNLLRAAWMFTATLAGYYLFGFTGFIYGAALSGLAPFTYYIWMQQKNGMLIAKYEFYKVAYLAAIAVAAYAANRLILAAWPNLHLRS
jgi:lipopolysaccharide exporter